MPRHTVTRKKYVKTLRRKPAKTLKWKPNLNSIHNTHPSAGSNWEHWRKKVPRRRYDIPTGPWMLEFQRRGSLKNYNGTLTRSRTLPFKRRNMYAHETALRLTRHLEENSDENSEEE